jgi:hypothetical protein
MTTTLTIRLSREEKRILEKLAGPGQVSQWVRSLIQSRIHRPATTGWADHFHRLLASGTEISEAEVKGWFSKNRR